MSFMASSHVKFACCGCFFVLFSTVLLCVKLVSLLAVYCMVCCRRNTRSVFGYQYELYYNTRYLRVNMQMGRQCALFAFLLILDTAGAIHLLSSALLQTTSTHDAAPLYFLRGENVSSKLPHLLCVHISLLATLSYSVYKIALFSLNCLALPFFILK